ncbi:MAG: hypothetical protein LBL15_03690 [Oscillospiraceae bacterium]|jgi:hypothetical protein|nr:hypothetical protein [Oscillospiraceae bacterium]
MRRRWYVRCVKIVSVDPDNEKYTQEAINELVRDKTLIIIAYRLSTIQRADQILVGGFYGEYRKRNYPLYPCYTGI